ncbi:MAG: iron complex transport system permease protein [Alphaproteobacteria bacterium]|jgi:iron complex transport system permease protein
MMSTRGLNTGLVLLVMLAFIGALTVGPAGLGLSEVLNVFTGSGSEGTRIIIIEVRLPRAILAALIGAALGLAGAVLQGYLRNPLAEPGLIGVSASGAFGAVMTLYTGLAGAFALALPLGGILGAAIGVTAVQVLAGRETRALSLILAGIAVTSFAGALTALVLNLAPSPFAALEIVFWMMGSLANRSLAHVWLAAPFIALGGALLLTTGRALDALTLGEDTAATLGFDLGSLRLRIITGTAIAVGAATAVAGAIGFIGLIVPHLLRPLAGYRPSALLPASALGGAALTLGADIAVRVISPGAELKLGVVTALIGAPFFLWLVMAERRRLA